MKLIIELHTVENMQIKSRWFLFALRLTVWCLLEHTNLYSCKLQKQCIIPITILYIICTISRQYEVRTWFTKLFSFNMSLYSSQVLSTCVQIFFFLKKLNNFLFILTSKPHTSKHFSCYMWRFLQMPCKVWAFLSPCQCWHVKPCIWETLTSSTWVMCVSCCFV